MSGWVAGAVVVGSVIGSQGAQSAADTAAQASGQASTASIGEQQRQFDINQANQAPYLAAGTGAINRLGAGVGAGGEFGATTPFNFQYDQNTDPSYGFRFSEGMRALEHGNTVNKQSGGAMKAAIGYGQNMGSQEYQNAFNRYLTGFNANDAQRTSLYNRLAGVAGTGQTSANQVGTAGANMASNVGNTLMSNAGNVGNAAMASAGLQSSAYGGAANMLGRMYGYGGYGRNNNYPSSIGAPAGVGSFDDPYANIG